MKAGAQKPASSKYRLISIAEACRLTSFSRSSIFLKCRAGTFPKPISLSDDGVRKAFLLSEVEAWIEARISARDHDSDDRQITARVQKLFGKAA